MVKKCTPGAPPASSSAHCSVAHATPSWSTASGSSSRERQRVEQRVGNRWRRSSDVNRRIWPTLVTGMMPGMIGTAHAGGARPRDEVEVHRVVEEEVA